MYSVILRGSEKIDNLKMKISLSESIDSIAYTADIQTVIPNGMKLMEGDLIEIVKNKEPGKGTVFKGIVWDKKTSATQNKIGNILCKERTVYIEESEDEQIFSKGTTASQRATQLCGEWNVPIGNFADTGVPLEKSAPKVKAIYEMMLDDLRETAEKGGGLFKYRMQNKLDLVQLGSNKKVHDITKTITHVGQTGTLQGMVTKIKVLGKQDDKKKTPVIGVFEKGTSKGTIQKVVRDEKIKNNSAAKQKADALFSGGEGQITTSGIDIPDIRAGDKVIINAFEIYVTKVTHNLGEPGTMELTLESLEQIRRKYYANSR